MSGLNPGPLESEATALPTAPQPIIIYNVKLTWLVKGNSYLVWFSSVWTSSRIVQVLQDRSTLPEADRASEAEPEIDGENEPTS